MKFDDASWHSGGDYPEDLPDEAAATHTGMFLAWCVLNDHAGEDLIEILGDDLKQLEDRAITPGAFFLRYCDGKFTDGDVAEDILPFVECYFAFEKGTYLDDYQRLITANLPTLYHAPDTWASYDTIAPAISSAFQRQEG